MASLFRGVEQTRQSPDRGEQRLARRRRHDVARGELGHRLRVSIVAEPRWGTRTTFPARAGRVGRRARLSKTSSPAAAISPSRSAGASARFVHDRAAGGVDEGRGRASQPPAQGPDEVAGLRG